MAWLLVVGLLLSQSGLAGVLGAGISAIASAGTQAQHAGTHQPDDGCTQPEQTGCQERCPGDTSDGTCPIACHDCTCCSGRVPAVIPVACVPSLSVQAVDAQPFVPEHPVLETYQRIFRPPRPSRSADQPSLS